VCKELRKKSAVPVLFLSAKNEEIDKVLALELGADDFVNKPFGVRELTARIRAISRRCLAAARQPVAAFRLGDLEIEPTKLRALRGSEVIELSLRETRLLQLFHERLGEALDRDALFNRGWGPEHYPNSRTLDQAIAQLRKKIGADIIQTVHGVGYRVEG
jgi:DNA-binding response OmpR family regulator